MKYSKNNNKWLAFTTFIILVLMVLVGIRLLTSKPQIALTESSTDPSCMSNVQQFSTSESCGSGKVRRVDYTCTDKSKVGYEGGSPGECIDTLVAYEHALTFCGKTCAIPSGTGSPMPTSTPTPTPTPSPSGSPIPTVAPSPSTHMQSASVEVNELVAKSQDNNKRCIKFLGRKYCFPRRK